MKASKFTESQNAFILKQREEGTQVTEICQATYFNWKKRYGGLLLDEMRRLKALEDENGRPDLGPGDVAGRHPQKAPPDDQRGRLIGRTKGGMNTKLHAVTDADGRPIRFFMTAGQVSDYIGAAALLGSLPAAEWLLGDRGDDADLCRDALKDKEIKPCITGRRSRSKPVKYDSLSEPHSVSTVR
jgi:hypothetical protein